MGPGPPIPRLQEETLQNKSGGNLKHLVPGVPYRIYLRAFAGTGPAGYAGPFTYTIPL